MVRVRAKVKVRVGVGLGLGFLACSALSNDLTVVIFSLTDASNSATAASFAASRLVNSSWDSPSLFSVACAQPSRRFGLGPRLS